MHQALAQLLASHCGPGNLEVWMEPFAGGAGAGLHLLECEAISEVWLIDSNPAIVAFWREVIDNGLEFAGRVRATVPTMEDFEQTSDVLGQCWKGEQVDDLAWSAFIINRCSRSGIMMPNVGPIGGRSQEGRYRLDARWNPERLADLIERIHRRGRLSIREGDAADHLAELGDCGFGDEVFAFVDPPYIAEGNKLYHAGMSIADHTRLAEILNSCHTPWLLTYDEHPLVLELYGDRRIASFEIPHTANRQVVAREYAVVGDAVEVPAGLQLLPKGETSWVEPQVTSPWRGTWH